MDFVELSKNVDLKPGVVVIFNFIDFDIHPKLNKRTGSVNDVKRLKNVFFAMDLDVHFVNNPNLKEFHDEISKLSEYDYSEYASLILVYMSHGDKKNVVYCKDGSFNFVSESSKIFKNRTLKGKPKYIAIQACKGEFSTNWIYESQHESPTDGSEISAMLTSSFEGFVSFLGEKGARFIEYFTNVLKESWGEKCCIEMFEQAMTDFNEDEDQQTATLHRFNFKDKFTYKNFVIKHSPTENEFVI